MNGISATQAGPGPNCTCHGIEMVWQKRGDGRPSGGGWKCTVKRLEQGRRYRAAHPEQHRRRLNEWLRRHPRAGRDRALRRRYGMTLEEYEARVAAQDGRCPLCLMETRLVVDHDHETNDVRGLLCTACNVRLGYVELSLSDADWMERAVEYMRAGR